MSIHVQHLHPIRGKQKNIFQDTDLFWPRGPSDSRDVAPRRTKPRDRQRHLDFRDEAWDPRWLSPAGSPQNHRWKTYHLTIYEKYLCDSIYLSIYIYILDIIIYIYIWCIVLVFIKAIEAVPDVFQGKHTATISFLHHVAPKWSKHRKSIEQLKVQSSGTAWTGWTTLW